MSFSWMQFLRCSCRRRRLVLALSKNETTRHHPLSRFRHDSLLVFFMIYNTSLPPEPTKHSPSAASASITSAVGSRVWVGLEPGRAVQKGTTEATIGAPDTMWMRLWLWLFMLST